MRSAGPAEMLSATSTFSFSFLENQASFCSFSAFKTTQCICCLVDGLCMIDVGLWIDASCDEVNRNTRNKKRQKNRRSTNKLPTAGAGLVRPRELCPSSNILSLPGARCRSSDLFVTKQGLCQDENASGHCQRELIWANYSDLTRPQPPYFRLVKYYISPRLIKVNLCQGLGFLTGPPCAAARLRRPGWALNTPCSRRS